MTGCNFDGKFRNDSGNQGKKSCWEWTGPSLTVDSAEELTSVKMLYILEDAEAEHQVTLLKDEKSIGLNLMSYL